MKSRIRKRASRAAAVAVAAMALGCAPRPSAMSGAIGDKVYTVTPDSVQVRAGIVAGEIAALKVTERVVHGSGQIAVPAKLTGRLTLKNVSADQSVRQIGAKIVYIDAQGQSMKAETGGTESAIRVASYVRADGLDPGQDTSQTLNVEFPAEALKANKLKEIRLELTYIASPLKEHVLNFPVSIGQ